MNVYKKYPQPLYELHVTSHELLCIEVALDHYVDTSGNSDIDDELALMKTIKVAKASKSIVENK